MNDFEDTSIDDDNDEDCTIGAIDLVDDEINPDEITKEIIKEQEVVEAESDELDDMAADFDKKPKSTFYVKNKDILAEIHKSKTSFCEFEKPEYHQYDCIPATIEDAMTDESIAIAKARKAKRLSIIAYGEALKRFQSGEVTDKPRPIDHRVSPDSVPSEGLIFRVTTYEHIPLSPGRKKTPKRESDHYVKLNFVPFKHYMIENGVLREVGRSHYHKGEFSLTHGRLTNGLGLIIKTMVNKYSERRNWRNYSYRDEMCSFAICQLCESALKFNEAKSEMAFGYYTDCISNSFTRIFYQEKNAQRLRDDLLIMNGATPSFTRQIEYELEIMRLREQAQEINKK